MKTIFFILAALVSLPFFASADSSVVINEIAWAGTAAQNIGSSDEWIELKNVSGASVDVSGWTLRAKDGTPNVVFSGSIPAGGFYLLERSDDNTAVSDISYDTFFTGALANLPIGEDLDLIDSSGAVVDSVHFASGWPAGAAGPDYVSMERIDPRGSGSSASNWASNDGSQINGKDAAGNDIHGTPRAENSVLNSVLSAPPPDVSPSSAISSSPTPSPNSASSVSSALRIKASLGEDRTVLAGSIVEFLGSASVDGKSANGLNFSWNFGDGSTGRGRAISHIYFFPGTYSVQVHVASDEDVGSDYLMVTVLSPQLRVTEVKKGPEGFIEVYNTGSERVDLGSLVMTEGEKPFIMPKGTFIGAEGVIAFSNKVTAFMGRGDALVLSTQNGARIDSVVLPAGDSVTGSFMRMGNVLVYAELPTPGVVEKGTLASGAAVGGVKGTVANPESSNALTLAAVAKPTVLGALEVVSAGAPSDQKSDRSDQTQASTEIALPDAEKNTDGQGIDGVQKDEVSGERGFPPIFTSKLFLAASIIIGLVGSAAFLLFRA